jgi:hypothetical protein
MMYRKNHRRNHRIAPLAVLALCIGMASNSIAAPYSAIPNGEQYLDTKGVPIQAHGGFVLKHEGVYYWVGENKDHNRASFKTIDMYKSIDLENWEPVGAVLSPDTLDANGNRVLAHCKVERPKILYNQATNKFVLWGHWENYSSYSPSRVVVATADKIEGPYTVTAKGHFRPGEGNTDGVGYHLGIPHPNLNQAPDANGNYPTSIPGNPGYPMSAVSGATNAELANFGFNATLKAVAVKMDSSGYPTQERSPIARADYTIGGAAFAELAAPSIYPRTTAGAQVVVNSNLKDRAYLVTPTQGGTIYYTIDGSTPVPGAAGTQLYADGTGLALDGSKTIKAITAKNGAFSQVSSVSYVLAAAGSAAPLYAPVISLAAGTYPEAVASLKLHTVSDGTTIYYSADGLDPDPWVKGENMGYGSRDYTLFQDPATNKAYLVTAQDNVFLRVWQLTDDFTDVVPLTQYPMFINQSREAPALVRHGDYIYMLTSRQSGWFPNQVLYTRTLNIADKNAWAAQKPIGDNTGWHSQPTQVLNLGSAARPEYLYLGDRWNPSVLGSSTYVWLPMHIDVAGEAKMLWHPEIDIDVAAGTVTGLGGQAVSTGKPVSGTASVASTATAKRTIDQSNDGIYYETSNLYQPTGAPFFWQVDLGSSVDLGRLDLSLRSVGGSDAAHRYTVAGSQDGSSWTELFNNSANNRVGFQSHPLSGNFRHVRVNVSQVWDVVHNQSAGWSSGIIEAAVYAKPQAWNAAMIDLGFEKPLTGTYGYQPAGGEWTFSGGAGDGSGISANASAFTAGNPIAPEGTQVAFLQRSGTVSRELTGLVPGKSYRITLQAAQRANKSGGQLGQTFDVLIGGALVASFAPPQSATTYRPYSATFVATAPFAALSIKGTNLRGGDNTIFVDALDIDQVN